MSSTNRGAVRNPHDFYATPHSAFAPLLEYLPRHADYWEPACGDGRIIGWLQASGRRAGGADLHMDHYCGQPVDFLTDTTRRDFIITNPPFTMALEFCDHAIRHANEVMMLLRLNFLGSQKRHMWWTEHEPNGLFVLSERPDFTGGGGDSCEYAWFYWGPQDIRIHHLKPTV